MAMAWPRNNQHGFTLIELLVSLAAMSAILLLLGGALRIMGRNWDANAGRIETLDMISRGFDLLARDAANLRRIAMPSGSPAYLFTGAAHSLAFVALEPPQPTEAGLYFIAYSVEANGGSAELIRSRAAFRQGMERFPGATAANRVPLMKGPGNYRFAFAYARIIAGKKTWFGEWPFDNRLPDLIRLDITDGNGAAVLASPMVLRVRTDAELECLTPRPGLCSAKAGGQLHSSGQGGAPQQQEGIAQ
jgi:general secretion pathway protein J